MKLQSTYTNWDFNNIWNISTSPANYPYLRIIPTIALPFPYPFSATVTTSLYTNLTKAYQISTNINDTIIETFLNKAHTNIDTIISVLDASNFPSSGYLLINNEIIKNH